MKKSIRSHRAVSMLLVVAMLISVFLFAAKGITFTSASDVPVVSADNTSALYTDDILSKAGITLSEGDHVIRKDSGGVVTLTIMRAFDVTVNFRGEVINVKCTDGTVAQAIESAGLTLTGAETVSPALYEEVYAGMEINVFADNIVTITADGETKAVSTKAVTVADLLAEIELVLGEDDVLSVNTYDEVYDGLEIELRRVEYKEEVKTEIIDYEFVTKESSSMTSGTSKIKQYGSEGEKLVTYKCKYVDGELIDSEVIKEEIIKEPVDRITLVGTKKQQSSSSKPSVSAKPSVSTGGAGTFTDHNGKKVSYSKVLKGSATAYYAAEGSHTATGVPVYKGGVAVNPKIIPYGTKMYIVSSDGSKVYGYATAVDTGGALMSGSCLVDVFYPTYGECVNWGRRNVVVYILD